MNIPNNKRKKESQEKIEKTFLKLIQKKNIDEISVSTICELSKLNRSTFYANYVDIYDLVDKVMKKMADDFTEIMYKANAQQNPNGYTRMFEEIKNNQIFFKTYFKLEAISPQPISQYDVAMATKYYDNKHIDYHIEFFRAGLNAVIRKWLNSGCKESPEEISKIIMSEYGYKNKS